MNLENPKEEINSLKSEHLNEGVQPIIGCVISDEEFGLLQNDFVKEFEDPSNSLDVKYGEYSDELEKKGFKVIASGICIISPIDDRNKKSFEYANCTGVVAVGMEKETGKNISFLTHQNPRSLKQYKESTSRALVESLDELKSRCTEGTIDIVIVGGSYIIRVIKINNNTYRDGVVQDEYEESIKVLSEQVRSVFGFEPVVISGPKMLNGEEKVFFNNENRRLYLVGPTGTSTGVKPFTQNNIDDEKPAWRPNEVETGFEF